MPPPADVAQWRLVGVQRCVTGFGASLAQPAPRPPTFLRLVRAGLVPGSDGRVAEFEGELFLGVTAFEAVRAHSARGLRLPLDVWLAVARHVTTVLATLPADDAVWPAWSGPRAFGVTADRRLVLFEGPNGEPVRWPEQQEWTRAPELANAGHRHARAVALTLAWLLEAWPTAGEPGDVGWDRRFHHPEADAEVARVLESALSGEAPLAALRDELAGLTRPAAPLARVCDVFLGATDALLARAKVLERRVRRWPPEWASGGLAVAVDAALERGLAPGRADGPAPRLPLPKQQVALPVTPYLELLVELESRAGRTLLFEAQGWWGPRVPSHLPWRRRGRARPEPGTPVVVTARHPLRREVFVRFDATVEEDGRVRLGAVRDDGPLKALLATQTPTDETPPPPLAPLGPNRWPVGLTLVTGGFAAAISVTAAYAADGRGWFVPWALLSLAALVPTSWFLMHWPLRRWSTLLVLFVAALTLAVHAKLASDRGAGGLVPWLLAAAFFVLTAPRHRFTWFHPGREWSAAEEDRGHVECLLCGRRHAPGASYARCQYAACRAPLEPGAGCTCAACEDAHWAHEQATEPRGDETRD